MAEVSFIFGKLLTLPNGRGSDWSLGIEADGGFGFAGQGVGGESENAVAAGGFHLAQDVVRGQTDQPPHVLRGGGVDYHLKVRPIHLRGGLRQLHMGNHSAFTHQHDYGDLPRLHVVPATGEDLAGLVIDPLAGRQVDVASRCMDWWETTKSFLAAYSPRDK